jgi:hypothetical protein
MCGICVLESRHSDYNLREESVSASIAVYVRQGVRYLDSLRPNWRSLVDVDRLDISQSDRCVVGQVFADEMFDIYSTGWEAWEENYAAGCGSQYGFNIGLTLDGAWFIHADELTKAWIEYLNKD